MSTPTTTYSTEPAAAEHLSDSSRATDPDSPHKNQDHRHPLHPAPQLRSVVDRPPTPGPRATTRDADAQAQSLTVRIPLRTEKHPVSIDLETSESESESGDEEETAPSVKDDWSATIALHEILSTMTPLTSIHDPRLAGMPYPLPLKVALVQASQVERLLLETRMEASRGLREPTYRVIRGLANAESRLKRQATDALTRQRTKTARNQNQ